MAAIDATSVVSPEGHTMLPRSIRARLQVEMASGIIFRAQDRAVTLHPVSERELQLARLTPFLTLLEADVAGVAFPAIPQLVAEVLLMPHISTVRADPNKPIIGKVTLS